MPCCVLHGGSLNYCSPGALRIIHLALINEGRKSGVVSIPLLLSRLSLYPNSSFRPAVCGRPRIHSKPLHTHTVCRGSLLTPPFLLTDRGGDGLLHGRWGLRTSNGRREHHRAQARNDFLGRTASGRVTPSICYRDRGH